MKFTRDDLTGIEAVLDALNDIGAKFNGTVSVDLESSSDTLLVVTYDSSRVGHVVDFGAAPRASVASGTNVISYLPQDR